MFLRVNQLKKVYGSKGNQVQALKSINFGLEAGEFIAIMGESGSGKSTLLNIIATLDQPTSGEVMINGVNVSQINPKSIAQFRRESLGFVFQDFNLLNTLNNRDNILLPLVLSNVSKKVMMSQLKPIAEKLAISHLLDKYPHEVSGGQKQRIAIARAIITQPDIILADEPTGALDSKSADNTMALFQQLNQEGHTILMVTHSIRAAASAGRVLFIRDGEVYNELYVGEDSFIAFQERIAETLSLLSRVGE